MITEIVNFIKHIDESYMTEKLKPSEGLHILIKLDDKGNLAEIDNWIIKKNTEPEDVPKYYEFGIRDYYSTWISNNKTMDIGDGKDKMQITSVNPFTLFFKKTSLESGIIFKKIQTYYKNILDLKIRDEKLKFTEQEINRINLIKKFLENELKSTLQNLSSVIDNLDKEDKKKKEHKIKIYFDEDITSLRKAYEIYLENKLLLLAEDNAINIKVIENGKETIYGMTSFLNTFGEEKKPFISHQTTNFKVNSRYESTIHKELYKFKRMLENKKLPNPLPIFIDKQELNDDVVRLFNREGIKGYRDIIKELVKNHKRDLSNYYLIFWSKYTNLEIKDFDFVPLFKFYLDDFKIITYFSKQIKEDTQKIKNVFDFERYIVHKIFNNLLVKESDEKKNGELSYSLKYFDNIEYNSKYMTKTTYLNVMKYRKSFYDFIYKSKQNAISNKNFRDILISGIIDDIKHDEYKNGKHTKDINIREKLNIFFSLNKNFGGEDMGSKILPLQEKLKSILNNSDVHIETDEEFAFSAGQLVYYLIYQSETANKTHSLMEPYISKSNPQLFKAAIAKGIDRYKHKLPFGTKKFQKLASEVLGWDTETEIKDLLPLFLAGYFFNSLLFESTKNEGV